jgi:hypothetical protein
VFKAIITDYLAFECLRERTKSDYLKQIAKIEQAFGDLPLAALDDAKVTDEFLSLARPHAEQGVSRLCLFTGLMLIIAWGRTIGMTTYRPPVRINKLLRSRPLPQDLGSSPH